MHRAGFADYSFSFCETNRNEYPLRVVARVYKVRYVTIIIVEILS